MESKTKEIVEKIKTLLDELPELSNDGKLVKVTSKKEKASIKKGAEGALTLLTGEGFFNSPREISTIMEKLEEIGRYYSKAAVSMNLLNRTKQRTFKRFKKQGSKNWLYEVNK